MIKLDTALQSFFTTKNLTDVLIALPKPQTPIKDLLFPESKRKQKTSPVIGIGEVENTTGAIPVVSRGSASYPVNEGKKEVNVLQPEGFKPSIFLSAKEVNDMIAIGETDSVNAKLNETVETLRDRISVSTEILCAQALSGEISYPAATAGGALDTYKVTLGAPKKMTDTDIAGKTIAILQQNLEQQFLEQRKTGCTTDVRYLVGTDVYSAIIGMIANTTSPNIPVQWTDYGCVLFGKYKLMPMSATYALPGTNTLTDVVDSKSIQTIDIANAGTLFYLALDDFDAGLKALPFFAKNVKSQDPSGYKIIGMSKPLPALAVSKTVIRKYLA